MAGRLLLALASASLFALALEGGARLVEGRPPWEVSLPAKAPGSFRLVALGGSTVLGTPVPELGFVAQLEALLRHLAPVRPIEVVNLGKEGSPSAWVRREVEFAAERGEADALLVLSAHNEFLNRAGEPSRLRDLAQRLALSTAVTRVLTRRFAAAPPPDPLPERLRPVDRGGFWFAAQLARYRDNLAAIARSARRRGLPLLLLTAPCNLADWAPVYRDLARPGADPDYEADVARAAAAIEAGRLDEAQSALSARRDRFGDDAMVLYLEGQIARRRGQWREARERLSRARDLDPIPWRALSQQNDAIRAVAAAGDGVHLVDAEGAMARHAGHGLVGFEWIGDNVHPTPLGGALMAAEVAHALARAGILLHAEPPDDTPEAARERFLAGLGAARRDRLERARLVRSGIYAMKTPFYRYDVARRYLEAARALAPDHWAAWANLGVLSLLEGDREGGVAALRRATRLRGAPLDPRDRVALPYLAIALARGGVAPEELSR